jgi:FkbM family methyltransferase
MKKKVIYIAPHLSTGGMPQYLYKEMELLQNDFDIYCIEWGDVTGGVLVVQRNKIKNLLGNRLLTLGENKWELFDMIKRIQPDVVHLQEIPELFMPHDIAKILYDKNRPYTIIETSHDSSTDPNQKRHFPDKFLFVSQYQLDLYKGLGIPSDVVEYPIEFFQRTKTKEEAQRFLGMDPNLKHVVNVGLFTPRKNQAEIVEYAKALKDYPIQFHFIGNHADNFRYYWEPIMKDFPSNCKWWNERTDVENFYQAADLFLFTSRGNNTDKETMPLVIREAISWQVPSLIYNLTVYQNYFDKYNNISYLDDTSNQQNESKILEKLELTKIYKKNMVYEFNSRWDLDEQKVYFSTKSNIDEPLIISIKEYKSDAVLWSSQYGAMPAGVEFWIMPISPQVHKYTKDTNYSGIKLCIYKANDEEEQIYEQPFFYRFVNIPTISLSNLIPYRMNYIEYFVDKKYDKFLNRKFENVIDVGANVGVFSKYLLEKKLTKDITAIECDTLALKDLIRNFDTDDRVKIISKALSASKQPVTFYQSKDNPVISSTLPPDKLKHHMAGVKGDNQYTVETITIEDLTEQYEYIDLLKIDIEGGEYDVIENTDDKCFKHINSLLIECHFFEDDYLEKYKKLFSKLNKNGYEIVEYTENQSNSKGYSECVFAKKIKN